MYSVLMTKLSTIIIRFMIHSNFCISATTKLGCVHAKSDNLNSIHMFEIAPDLPFINISKYNFFIPAIILGI